MAREEGGQTFRRVFPRDCDSPVGFMGGPRLRSAPLDTKNGHSRKHSTGLRCNMGCGTVEQVGAKIVSPRSNFRRVKSYHCDLSNIGQQGVGYNEDEKLVVIGKPVKVVVKEEQYSQANAWPSQMKKSRSTTSLLSMDNSASHKQTVILNNQNQSNNFVSLQPGSFVAFNSAKFHQQQQHHQQYQHQESDQVKPLHLRGDSAMLANGHHRGSCGSLNDSCISSEVSRDTSASPAPSSVYIDPQDLVAKDAEPLCPNAPLKPRETLKGYKLGKTLGKGGFCSVLEGFHKLSGRRVAVKVIEKGKIMNGVDRKRINFEVNVLKKLHHENIIKLYEVVERNHQMYLVTEHCPGGSLLEYIKTNRQLKEQEAAKLLIQIVAGLQHSHDLGIVHRDVKLENLLLCNDQKQLKLIDFGLSGEYVEGRKLTVSCGSPSYAAPEIHKRAAYNATPVDVWSTGVVLYAMLFGMLPFRDANKSRLSQKIISGKFHMPESLSGAGKDLLCRMLTVDPNKRITLKKILQHPWIVPHITQEQSNTLAVPCHPNIAPHALVIDILRQYGHDSEVVQKELAGQVCSGNTAAYYLLSLNLQDRYKVFGCDLPPHMFSPCATEQTNTPRSLVLYHNSVQNIQCVLPPPAKAW